MVMGEEGKIKKKGKRIEIVSYFRLHGIIM